MRIVFMGSPEFAVPALERLIESGHEVAGVVTQPDRPAGRGRDRHGTVLALSRSAGQRPTSGRALRPPAAKEVALRHGIAVLQPERVNSEDSLASLRALAPDVLVIAAYGQILKQPLLDIPKRGSLNVHASLLPKYRGAAPAAAAILAGEETTGVSILEVILALDAGPVVAQRELAIEPADTTGSLNERLSRLGADLLIEVLPAWERGDVAARPQDDSAATLAPSIRRQDAAIDWSLPAVDVWRCARAYNPWPVAFTTLDGERLRILEAWPLEDEPDPSLRSRAGSQPGTVDKLTGSEDTPPGAGFAVRCGSGRLAVVRAQRAGKRAVSGEELLRGMRELAGARLGP